MSPQLKSFLFIVTSRVYVLYWVQSQRTRFVTGAEGYVNFEPLPVLQIDILRCLVSSEAVTPRRAHNSICVIVTHVSHLDVDKYTVSCIHYSAHMFAKTTKLYSVSEDLLNIRVPWVVTRVVWNRVQLRRIRRRLIYGAHKQAFSQWECDVAMNKVTLIAKDTPRSPIIGQCP